MNRIIPRLTAALTALPLAWAALAGPAQAEQASIGDRWPVLARDRSGDCELTIASTGKAMQLRARGLIPGEELRFFITNGDMKPIALSAFADSSGGLLRYYLPFRFNRDGGTVRVAIAAARCNLFSAVNWDRELHTIE